MVRRRYYGSEAQIYDDAFSSEAQIVEDKLLRRYDDASMAQIKDSICAHRFD